MMAKLGILILLGLFLRVTVCSVSSTTQCEMDEFKHENLCCQYCPAGFKLINPCQKNHGTSECAPCESNYFTAHKNSESGCFPCSMCRDDQEEVTKCSSTTDRECQCKQGTYCNSENCLEMCHACSSCPGGRVIRKCNATMDTVCDTFDSKQAENSVVCYFTEDCSASAWKLNIVVIAAVIIIIAAVITVIRKIICYCRKRDRRALNSVNGTVSASTPL
ncbi:tumor necrosis factor receptor superfamily member 26-like isoform X2 [Arvicanthis niloticus]|uniref:tumor necrosis factor receptor superfamily member 26-like isoform X2 n=1 Tax=Arvicanthis niloticus TaxID=61156 RepID=UPI0014869D40|nr:tumor necrosis factor receptor superfamily member 26-like isoform X1 [Arvicanthis niloticus]